MKKVTDGLYDIQCFKTRRKLQTDIINSILKRNALFSKNMNQKSIRNKLKFRMKYKLEQNSTKKRMILFVNEYYGRSRSKHRYVTL